MIFLDSNIPMYLVGVDHDCKVEAKRSLERLISDRVRLVTDAEVFQEILHRYVAINRPNAIQPAFDLLSAVIDEVFAIEVKDVIEAKNIVGMHAALSSRDALHLAIMRRYKVETIFSFDQGFDDLTGIIRIP